MLTQEPLLNSFVAYLSETVRRIMAAPQDPVTISFSQSHLGDIRKAFAGMLLRGERKLHLFAELVSREYVGAYLLSSVVFGEIENSRERFVLSQSISSDDLYSITDLDLGNRQLSKLRFFQNEQWVKANLVANVVEYQPVALNSHQIQKIISRIKAEEEIWNKVVDEIFDLDSLVKRDKLVSHLSFFVKDVFGIKIVVAQAQDVVPLHQTLLSRPFAAGLRQELRIPVEPSTESIEVLEVKNYGGAEYQKQSGWDAIKSVISWWGKTIEVQILPLSIYLNEREYLTQESHAGFRSRREELRSMVTREIPLFGFMRALLQWVFVDGNDPAKTPHFPGISIEISP